MRMKPMSLNLSKMKKVSGDKNSSTFLHPSGHKMVIAHAGVSALQRKQLEKMTPQKMFQGGEPNSSSISDTEDQAFPVTSHPETSVAQDVGSGIRKAIDWSSNIGPIGMVKLISNAAASEPAKDFVKGISGSDGEDEQNNAVKKVGPAEPSSPPIPVDVAGHSEPLPDSNSKDASPVDLNKSYQQGQRAISEQQDVSSLAAKSQEDIQNKDIADRQSLMKMANDNYSSFKDSQQKFLNDYADGHINPKHYVENMSLPHKIFSAIGMLLGGAGAGPNQPNPGAELLNNQINRDITGQQSRMDQQKTLLGANQAMFHDNVLAQNQTRMNMNDLYDHQIQLAASKLGTQQAKVNADQAHARFAMENAQLLQQNVIRKTVLDHLGQGGSGLSAVDLAHAGIIPQGDALKEQASIDAQNAGIKQIQDLYSRLGKEQTLANRVGSPIQSGSNVDALNAQITNAVMGADVSKRLTPESAKLEVLPFHVNLKDSPQTVNNKMMGVMDLIKQHNAGLTPMMNRYSPQSLPKYPTPQAQPIKMIDNKTGKIWLADPNTKKFIGWGQ